ncbi:YrdB family protein [Actinokineospora sp.]|uniref:YrdB family protein n=1 Tax=Actinokineospora sp. TaxID=1872133 RepID=UPI003D6A355E
MPSVVWQSARKRSEHLGVAVRGLQLTSALLLELAVFAAFAYWGWTVHWAVGIAAFAVVTVAWGLFLSPKAKFPLPTPAKLTAKAFVFAGAAFALVATGATVLGLVFGALLVVLLVSEAVWPWAHLA